MKPEYEISVCNWSDIGWSVQVDFKYIKFHELIDLLLSAEANYCTIKYFDKVSEDFCTAFMLGVSAVTYKCLYPTVRWEK